MNSLKGRKIVMGVTLMFALTMMVVGCGTLMHPNRRTATPTHKIDGTALVLDCLWLLPGIVPGFIALGVDFFGDTIYYSESELHAHGGDKVSIDMCGKAPVDSLVTLRLLDQDGRDLVVPTRIACIKGSELGAPLTLTIPEGIEVSNATLTLAVADRPQVTWSLKDRVN
jgi:hypothetical protein